jgi:hypothetical protein
VCRQQIGCTYYCIVQTLRLRLIADVCHNTWYCPKRVLEDFTHWLRYLDRVTSFPQSLSTSAVLENAAANRFCHSSGDGRCWGSFAISWRANTERRFDISRSSADHVQRLRMEALENVRSVANVLCKPFDLFRSPRRYTMRI